jgi:hypothetical protein
MSNLTAFDQALPTPSIPTVLRSGLPAALVSAEPSTTLPLPHATWNDDWRPLLTRFARTIEADRIRPRRVSYEALPLPLRLRIEWFKLRNGGREPRNLYTVTWHVPVNDLADRGVRAEMLQFAHAFLEYELPAEDAVILTRMLDGHGPDTALAFIGWLRAAIVQIAGEASSAIAAPTGAAGQAEDGSGVEGDNSFEPHSDMWIPALLFNLFNRTVPGQGETTLMPIDDLWEIAASVGMPAQTRYELRLAPVEAGECDYFDHFNGRLYGEHPWADAMKAALFAASMTVPMAPGEGYLINDRRWLHGRTALDARSLAPEDREHRLYRLAYNNKRLEAAAARRRLEWSAIGRHASACKA